MRVTSSCVRVRPKRIPVRRVFWTRREEDPGSPTALNMAGTHYYPCKRQIEVHRDRDMNQASSIRVNRVGFIGYQSMIAKQPRLCRKKFCSGRYMTSLLMYASAGTRPDIAFAVHQAARHVEGISRKDLDACKRIFHCRNATADFGITFGGKNNG